MYFFTKHVCLHNHSVFFYPCRTLVRVFSVTATVVTTLRRANLEDIGLSQRTLRNV